MSISNRFFVQSTTTLLAVGLFVLAALVGMNFWLTERAQVYFNDVIAARDARATAVELRNALQTAESSQRGFLVTGNEIYLAPYDVAKTVVARQMQATRENFAQYPALGPLIDRTATIVGQKLAEMDETIGIKRQRRDDDALALFRTNRGKAIMDEANVLFSGAIRAADTKLVAGVTEHRKNAILLRWFSIIDSIIIVAILGAATLAVVRYTRDLAHARDEVTSLNASLERRVAERTSQLAEANEEVQRFAYIVTHDLRAPLVNIVGFTGELENGIKSLQALIDRSDAAKDQADPIAREARIAASEDLPEAIGFIRSSTRKMDGLINAILKISRQGARTLRPEPIDLEEMVRTAAVAVSHQISEAHGAIEFDVGDRQVVSDRPSLEHIFGNLFDNAVKYRLPDRPLRIRVSAVNVAGDRVRVDIEDNGRGIAEQDQERVFELFRRAGSQDKPGEGIGLSSVRTIARKLGGDVSVRSKLGEGTTFSILLPRELQLEESAAA